MISIPEQTNKFILSLYQWIFINFLHYFWPTYRKLKNENFEFSHLPIKNCDEMKIIFELGCNDGTTTLTMCQLFPLAKIYCFEPDPKVAEIFKKNTKEFDNQIIFEQAAISNLKSPEYIPFYSSTGIQSDDLRWRQSGSYLKPKLHSKLHPHIRFGNTIKVFSFSLDYYCLNKEIPKIDLLWMDTQGSEFQILSSSKLILQKTKFIFLEHSIMALYENQKKLKNILEILPKFKIYKLYPHDALLINSELT